MTLPTYLREEYDENGFRLLWKPHPGMQYRALASPHFELFVGGAKGPGKSDIIVMKPLQQVHKELFKAYIIRETGPQLSEIKDRMHRYYPRLPSRPAWNGDGHGKWTFPSGAKIILEAVGTPVEAERVQGKEPSFVGWDEVANIKDEKTIDTVQAEIRSPDPSIVTQFVGTGNPGRTGHVWIKRRYIDKCGKDGRKLYVRKFTANGKVLRLTRQFIPGTVLDNPIYANDPRYMAQLLSMPEVLRRQLLYGDWDAGVGAALDELDEAIHIVPRFEVPDHWPRFGSFDWGFAHNWVFGWYAVSEDRRVYKIDTVRGRRMQPHEISERIISRVDLKHPMHEYNVSDSYPFQSKPGEKDGTPKIYDLMRESGVLLTRAQNIDRKAGLQNLRYRLAWRGMGKRRGDGLRDDDTPFFMLMDTPGNRWCFDQLEAMVTDETDMEDVLKVDADPETGQGGDDAYDETRIALASRPQAARGHWKEEPVKAFSRETLHYMTEKLYRDAPLPAARRGRKTLAHHFIKR